MEPRGNPVWLALLSIVVGAALGLALGAGLYSVIASMLESAGRPLVDLQGLAWNLVPFGALGGGLLGWWVGNRWQRRRRQ